MRPLLTIGEVGVETECCSVVTTGSPPYELVMRLDPAPTRGLKITNLVFFLLNYRAKLSIVLLVSYNRQNDTLLVSYSEDFFLRRTTNFLKPVDDVLVHHRPPSLSRLYLAKSPSHQAKVRSAMHLCEGLLHKHVMSKMVGTLHKQG